MGIVGRLSRRYNARADARYATLLTPPLRGSSPPPPIAEPRELIDAFAASPSARAVYARLEPEERDRLHHFVSAPWLTRNRTAHAATVVRKCGEGSEAVRALLDFNSTIGGIAQPPG